MRLRAPPLPPGYARISVANACGGPVAYLAETGSTMDDARELCAQSPEHGTVLVAGHQTAGRGRGDGRIWLDEAGQNLLFSVILQSPAAASPPVPLIAAVAVARALEREYGLSPQIKWPNDIILQTAATPASTEPVECKPAGILAEYRAPWLVLGIGLNVDQRRFAAGPEIAPTSLALHGITADRYRLLAVVLDELQLQLAEPAWQPLLHARLWRCGREVRLTAPDGTVHRGVVAGVDRDGRLLLKPSGLPAGDRPSRQAFAAGRLAPPGGRVVP